ncbi:MAG: PorV/PorQ family protein [Candidatus Marinimicrobia bacterium]|nr:PorV/PorQ family protein [Candidatus Neomarinimicrobiota bacterium]
MKYRNLAVLSLITFLTIQLSGEIEKKAQTGFRFLENPVSAEAIGRGGLGLVSFRNANTTFWNPAGLGWLENRLDFNANYTKGIADINHSSFALAMKLGNFGMLGLDLINMDYGEFIGTRRADNEEGFIKTGNFSPSALALGVSFAQRVSDRFSYGVKVKYAYQDLGSAWVARAGTSLDDSTLVIDKEKYNMGEPAIDIGATYDFLNHGIRFGATMTNISREIKYERESAKFPLPFAVSFSLGLAPLTFTDISSEMHDLFIGFESVHPRDFKEKLKFGAEYTYLKMFLVRTGYMLNYDERGLTFGLGVKKKMQGMDLRMDYAYQDFGIFNGVHTVSLGFSK